MSKTTNNTEKFLDAYNRLDSYLHEISGISSKKPLIAYLENVLPPEKGVELKKVREFRNTNAHGMFPAGVRLEPPQEWIDFLEELIVYCKDPKNSVGERLKENS